MVGKILKQNVMNEARVDGDLQHIEAYQESSLKEHMLNEDSN